ncbi:MAG: polysulfide reductase NrfD, partial [Betaproteobacteria bacterium]|nr:polysulfide reductase NrfD [Betaproteobacteria bacterium]
KAEWRRPITRVAEAITVFALLMGSSNVLWHLGRPELIYTPLLYPQPLSPLIWDVVCISLYFIGSLTYLYLPLIPDLALLRDRSPRWRWFYRALALGWQGTERQHHRLMVGGVGRAVHRHVFDPRREVLGDENEIAAEGLARPLLLVIDPERRLVRLARMRDAPSVAVGGNSGCKRRLQPLIERILGPKVEVRGEHRGRRPRHGLERTAFLVRVRRVGGVSCRLRLQSAQPLHRQRRVALAQVPEALQLLRPPAARHGGSRWRKICSTASRLKIALPNWRRAPLAPSTSTAMPLIGVNPGSSAASAAN